MLLAAAGGYTVLDRRLRLWEPIAPLSTETRRPFEGPLFRLAAQVRHVPMLPCRSRRETLFGICMSINIRPYHAGEEAALRNIFFDSVHELASADYSEEQLWAWAPQDYDEEQWRQRIAGVKPFVADSDGVPAGFADLQPDGYIDLFFVSPRFARQGVGRALMSHLFTTARQRNIRDLRSNVSLTAEPFFAKHGFLVKTRNTVQVRGQVLHNATMVLAFTD